MAWVRIEDGLPEHRKFVEAGDEAAWMFICGLAYSARALTDGWIPDGQVPKLTGLKGPFKLAKRLADAGLWEREDGGYRIHDYLVYQPSAAQVLERRRNTANRVKKHRCNGVTSPLLTPHVTPHVTPDVTELVTGDVTPTHAHVQASGSGMGVTETSEETTNGVTRKRVDQDRLHDSFPAELTDLAVQVLKVLRGVQAEAGGHLPTLRGVGLAFVAFPDRDFVGVARELEHWALAGPGQGKSKDYVRLYRTFLDRSPKGSALKVKQAAKDDHQAERLRRAAAFQAELNKTEET